MALKDFLSRGKENEDREANIGRVAHSYAQYQVHSSKGQLAYSKKQVALLTVGDDMRRFLRTPLTSVSKAHGYTFLLDASTADAINSLIVIMDGRPEVIGRMHREYNKIVRIKKSMGKFGRDLLCAVGPRDAAREYRTGTYGKLLLFCYDPEAIGRRDPAIPPEGLPGMGGPTLFNLADMPEVLGRWMAEHKN